ncbi:MAG TPA: hypothetical protein ENJ82_12365 [Bacteroidetes bacterium]|nr:hypothetical protein [Bacteroidota bacterium]
MKRPIFRLLVLLIFPLFSGCTADAPPQKASPKGLSSAPAPSSTQETPSSPSIAEEIAASKQTGVFLGKLLLKSSQKIVEANIGMKKISTYAEQLRLAVAAALSNETNLKGRLTLDCTLRPDAVSQTFLNYAGMSKASLQKAEVAIRKVPDLHTQKELVSFQVNINVSIP